MDLELCSVHWPLALPCSLVYYKPRRHALWMTFGGIKSVTFHRREATILLPRAFQSTRTTSEQPRKGREEWHEHGIKSPNGVRSIHSHDTYLSSSDEEFWSRPTVQSEQLKNGVFWDFRTSVLVFFIHFSAKCGLTTIKLWY